jgi:hypothetical protein
LETGIDIRVSELSTSNRVPLLVVALRFWHLVKLVV